MHLLLSPTNPFPPPQSQPKPSSTLPSSSSSTSYVFSSLYRSPRRTPLPPSSLLSRFYRSQALLCCSLDLLFFITAGQPLPSSLAATAAPLCSACTLLPLPLQLPQPPPRSRPPLPPRPPLFLPFAPHDTTASSLVATALGAAATSNAPLSLHLLAATASLCCPFLLSASPARRNPATTSFSIVALSAYCRSHFQLRHLPL
ncbi:hypothetical protein B296_00008282 [Ensete ventricosum]|uniref:Uncharacterized protein n=1 Tax=Ensete ventricosum TaxID=4639 RepID=A0A426YZ95_ENSVE|nr:hypothetical protein B296_00008282 [Ensete ventricosum]